MPHAGARCGGNRTENTGTTTLIRPMIGKPIPESYWVVPDHFLAGAYPGLRFLEFSTSQRLTDFVNAGFDTFIDLTNENERPPYAPILRDAVEGSGREIRHQRFSFPDFHVPPRGTMIAALDAIDSAMMEGRKVYLHCVGGIGRTGTTVGCYLVRHGMEPEAALSHLQELYHSAVQSLIYPNSPESEVQIKYILDWKE